MNNYIFNDCNVCINADKVGVAGDYFNHISVAQAPNGKWGYGYWAELDSGESGSCSPLMKRYCTYTTREAALMAACDELRRMVKRQESSEGYEITSWSEDGRMTKRKRDTCNRLRACIEYACNAVQQLTLF